MHLDWGYVYVTAANLHRALIFFLCDVNRGVSDCQIHGALLLEQGVYSRGFMLAACLSEG